ncbi:hypothetical protein B296_00055617, partial [Ensete ventricosum]
MCIPPWYRYRQYVGTPAVIENVSLKQQIFADLEKYCSLNCVLATNTSTIDLNLVGEKTKSRDRIVGAHFFRVADLVGFGVAVATGMQYLQSFPERVYKSMLMSIMIEDKRTVGIHLWFHSVTGEATRKGFYKYDNKRKASPDPELMKYIEKSRNMAGVTPNPEVLSPLLMKLPDKDIVEMVFFPVVNEACRVLDEGIAVKASDLDIASIMGMECPSQSDQGSAIDRHSLKRHLLSVGLTRL